MAKSITIKIIDNSDKVLDEFEDAVKRALMTCGLEAQGKAIEIITRNRNVDTGLLRSSIAYALGGESATPQSYRADVYGDGSGSYSGKAPNDEKGKYTVYIGTNVEYAQNIECGTSKNPSGWPFLTPAVKNYKDKYKKIIKEELGG